MNHGETIYDIKPQEWGEDCAHPNLDDCGRPCHHLECPDCGLLIETPDQPEDDL